MYTYVDLIRVFVNKVLYVYIRKKNLNIIIVDYKSIKYKI